MLGATASDATTALRAWVSGVTKNNGGDSVAAEAKTRLLGGLSYRGSEANRGGTPSSPDLEAGLGRRAHSTKGGKPAGSRLSGGPDGFVIRAIHRGGERPARASPSTDKNDCTAPHVAVAPHKRGASARTVRKPSAPLPYEVTAFDAQLRNMLKLQLGPLTLGRDVAPVLEMWSKLVAMKQAYGLKATAASWAALAQATTIVAKKFSLDDVAAVLSFQLHLANPCPRSLRLPAGLLTALADRAVAGGQLRVASDPQLEAYCRAAGQLLRVAGSYHTADLQHIERALERVAATMPLVQAGMEELLRRCRIAGRRVVKGRGAACGAVEACLSAAEVLAHLGGCAEQPQASVQKARAAASASIEAEKARLQAMPWWQRAVHGMGALPAAAAAERAAVVLPTYLTTSSMQAAAAAGAAADCLVRCLAPAAVEAMSAAQLGQFASALCDASAGDGSQPAAEPLLQCLCLVLAEAAHRAEGEADDIVRALDSRCVQAVVAAARARILNPPHQMPAPAYSVPRCLASLKAWQSRRLGRRMRRPSFPPAQVMCSGPTSSGEATSLEMQLHEEGDEASGGR